MWRNLLSRLRPQFSLRMLLFAMTGLSILFALGYVWWPTVERVRLLKGQWEHEQQVQQWRVVHREYRDFRGNPVKHGPLRVYDLKGKLLLEENWHHGVRHGPWKWTASTYSFARSGYYRQGELHGVWVEGQPGGSLRSEREYERGELLRLTNFARQDPDKPDELQKGYEERFRGKSLASSTCFYPNGAIRCRVPYQNEKPEGTSEGWQASGARHFSGAWREGRPVGTWMIYDDSGKPFKTLDLDQGPVADATSRFVDAFFGAQLYEDSNAIRSLSLPMFTGPASQESLARQFEMYREFFNIRMILSRRRVKEANFDPDAKGQITFSEIPVAVSFPLAFHEHGLAAVYRHGLFLVTSRKDAESWTDRTGLDRLAADETSALHAKWSEPTTEQTTTRSLAELISLFAAGRGIDLQADWKAIELAGTSPGTEVPFFLNGLSFKDALSHLCEEYQLHCREEHGKLILEPWLDGIQGSESAKR